MPKKSRLDRLPGDAYSEQIHARFWLIGTDQKGYLGVGKVRLMELIDELGSISQAAKTLGMSYKRAWSLIEEVNKIGSQPYVTKEVGGAGGGHATLTEAGRKAIGHYRELETEFRQFIAQRTATINL
ncbi:winged helix-turn-helix domain-containing protein [Halothiobacillus neapolitanus]|uniref:Putative transcriptional regulator, ModE family n=1 Tax=Halothiobacillus neapolitanus (strain ATCC 23641 / DSM 15147 / CIP 104769 / NCIMB 8539 / c2) TaxID=555778 RepID=D0L0L6_HALNC|nr:LysR family transcriptional regulator [Halothiobacillus neapolitanus]ACX96239.1 putative transcriptional regulator, ModE family [Halothiobacillus neapolitanus c2]TDN66548.1 molybdate transport system regulatory protein [Halothiobacillus neapolitanus]